MHSARDSSEDTDEAALRINNPLEEDLTGGLWILMWQPSAPMTPSRPHVRWKMIVDTLFSQPVGQETKVRPRADMMVSTQSMAWCADERETS